MHDGTSGSRRARATEWLSRGFEALIEQIAKRPPTEVFDYDVVVIGSGYGGATALARLAGLRRNGQRLRIALLERGREYLPGSFPSKFADMAGHVRFCGPGMASPRGVRTGLFDVRVGPDLHSIVANGLGGGSLINAGALDIPHDNVFDDPRWPAHIRDAWPELKCHAEQIRDELGAMAFPNKLVKQRRMQELAPEGAFRRIPITVVSAAHTNAQGIPMKACLSCGDCATGCNHEAKSSLDVTLLVSAARAGGVDIYTGATALRLERAECGWEIVAVHTEPQRRIREPALRVKAERVILAAGTFGSPEILMRSTGIVTSPLLGRRFSANGDAMSAFYEMDEEARAAAQESEDWTTRDVGPTITSCIDLRKGDARTDMVVEEMTIPGALRRAFEEIVLTADALRRLGERDARVHPRPLPEADPNAVDQAKIARTMLVATIGHDDADGHLVRGEDAHEDEEGMLSVMWPDIRGDDRFARQHRTLQSLAQSGPGGQVLANPMWRPLPENVSSILKAPLGPMITVHPLGGCSIGSDWRSGVVDHLGRVFDGPGRVMDDLVVLDGSIVPTSLGINPALTITLLSDRAIRSLVDIWKYAPTVDAGTGLSGDRPVYREPPKPVTPKPTTITVSEKLCGRLALSIGGAMRDWDVELEIRSTPLPLSRLFSATGPREIELDPGSSRLRVFTPPTGETLAIRNDGNASFLLALAGKMTLLDHAPSGPWRRGARGLAAWLRNRGIRDVAQGVFERLAGAGQGASSGTLRDRVRLLVALATRAGDARLLEYELQAIPLNAEGGMLKGRIRGIKTLTYGFASNPWTQLQEVELEAFPQWTRSSRDDARLAVDLTYFEKTKSILLSLVDQQDMPSAISDLASLSLYLMRTILHVHAWSFRKPDPPTPRTPQRLPAHLPGLQPPQIHEFAVSGNRTSAGLPVMARLTRYRERADTVGPPILLIHGYSASGTTFAHPAVEHGGLAGHLARRGRDVWVVDLRSSSGMPTAREPWTFDEVGYADIPLAVDQVLRSTGHRKLDVVAHCMGSAMLSMALLGRYPPQGGAGDPEIDLRRLLPERIRGLVMSQVGPRLHMSPANVARAYLMRYLQHYLPLDAYSFRPEGESGQGLDFLDGLLASVPYSEDEFRLENPIWPLGARTPWAGTRHRLDALYGVTFKLDRMPRAVLDCIDDFFGPLNVHTATQVIHFTRGFRITDASGRDFVSEADIETRLAFPVLSLHSVHNGLVDYSTRLHMEKFMSSESRRSEALPGHGHQDALIGTGAHKTFERIARFFEEIP